MAPRYRSQVVLAGPTATSNGTERAAPACALRMAPTASSKATAAAEGSAYSRGQSQAAPRTPPLSPCTLGRIGVSATSLNMRAIIRGATCV